ncbi:Hypothetical protein CINCED_3A021822 [Cinara cedri]|uniref:USP domain-containing protein n=1 Tax=Cinara cedri TaxID=506608 RepID=A0A5E4NLC4_9HEMI|nr:Hypothetical protein CINCED_3A021822 [Cinara cedri]
MADTSEDVCETNSSATGIVASNVEEHLEGSGEIAEKPENDTKEYSNKKPYLFNVMNYLNNFKTQIMKSISFVDDTLPQKHVNNTCAFDSVLQVIIVALKNNSSLQEAFKTSKNSFIKMAQYVIIHGWKDPQANELRINLLHEYLENDKSRVKDFHGRLFLNCAISVPHVILHTFRNDPSCEEVSKCANGCTNLPKKRAYVTIPYKELLNENFDDLIADYLSLPVRPCEYCTSMVETKLEMTGSFMFFEVEDADSQKDIELKCIPQSFSITVCEEKKTYKLRGIIHFIRPTANIQLSTQLSKNPLGHYTAICPESRHLWAEYDDICNKHYDQKRVCRTNQFKCCPSLLIYSIL